MHVDGIFSNFMLLIINFVGEFFVKNRLVDMFIRPSEWGKCFENSLNQTGFPDRSKNVNVSKKHSKAWFPVILSLFKTDFDFF